MENLLLAVTALRFGTCWMTGPLHDEQSLRRILEIPKGREIVGVTLLGYPAEMSDAPPRIDHGLSTSLIIPP